MTKTATPDGRDRWLVPSSSSAGVERIVVRHKGVFTCDCPAGVRGRRCWHVTAVAAFVAADEASARQALVAEGVGLLFAAGRRQPAIGDGSWEGR